MKSLSCPNKKCPLAGKSGSGKIVGHGFYKTKWGRRRRFRCCACGKTFCLNSGTPYHRIHHRRTTFDEVAALSVEGVNKSAIARIKRIGWNTVDRCLQRATEACRRFNNQKIDGVLISELQADEIRTIIHGKEQPIWRFAAIEVWSRLWPSTVVGRRSYRSAAALFRDISIRSKVERVPLTTTDGFPFYAKVIHRVFGPACLYGQVMKTRRNDRVIKVERKALIGTPWRFEQALRDSEDSSKLNTSFIERLNLTIRQGSAYLCRRTICQARWKERLENHLDLFRCYYNFMRPHRALKFGPEIRTPAMQAGLASTRLSFREVFAAMPGRIIFVIIIIVAIENINRADERKMAA
jgi:transposase-like protein/IS1 family transposase